jgi:hypothetical protein
LSFRTLIPFELLLSKKTSYLRIQLAFQLNLCADNGLTSAKASRSLIIDDKLSFSDGPKTCQIMVFTFLRIPKIWLAQPERCLCIARILLLVMSYQAGIVGLVTSWWAIFFFNGKQEEIASCVIVEGKSLQWQVAGSENREETEKTLANTQI